MENKICRYCNKKIEGDSYYKTSFRSDVIYYHHACYDPDTWEKEAEQGEHKETRLGILEAERL